MKEAAAAFLLIMLTSSNCLAQGSQAETFLELGRRLDEVQRALQPPVAAHPAPDRRPSRPAPAPVPGWQTAMKMVADFQNNPWVRVKGFKVKLGFPTGIDIDFDVPPAVVPPAAVEPTR
jgi:hypothetical protein